MHLAVKDLKPDVQRPGREHKGASCASLGGDRARLVVTKRVATLTSEEWRRFLFRASEILNRGGNTVDTMTALAQQVLRFCNARCACVYLFNEANELDGFINVGLDVRTAAEAEKYGHTQWLTSYFKSPGGPMLHSVDGGSGYP